MPIKHDGAGFRRITIQPNASELFAAWCLIVQVGAKCKIRGVLADTDGVALDAEDLAIKTGFPVSIFESAFEFFSSGKLNWLKNDQTPSEIKDTPSEVRKTPTKKTHSTVQDKTDKTDKIPKGAKAPSVESVWALDESKRLLSGVSKTLNRKLIAKPASAPILKLLKSGITQAEVSDMISAVILKSGEEYFPDVQSSSALHKKWSQLQTATAQSTPKPQTRIYPKSVVPTFVNVKGSDNEYVN
jgi:hypothetical protein